MINDVSDISKLERGILSFEKNDVEINEFIKEISEGFKNLLGTQFEFYSEIKGNIVVTIDSERIHQVLDNVVNNAIKNTSVNDRKIILNVKSNPAIVQIEIIDNGAGIDSSNLQSIFESFTTFETQYSARGTGIGLFLCKIICQAHGGTITAQSRGLGHGSTFFIEIPRKQKNSKE